MDLSILKPFTFNSLCEIPIEAEKQEIRRLLAFNSLCEIQVMERWKNENMLESFNSLCEIPGTIKREKELKNKLSILFVRFKTMESLKGRKIIYVFQFSL